jgi:hypothetical protein
MSFKTVLQIVVTSSYYTFFQLHCHHPNSLVMFMVPRSAAPIPPGNLQDVQILHSHQQPTEWKL